MKKLFDNRKIVLLLAAVITALAMAAASFFMAGTASPVTDFLGIIASPFQKGFMGISDRISDIYSYIYDFDTLKAENERLKQEISEMQREIMESREANDENERLRKLLELREKRRDFELEPASVIARSTTNWESSLTTGKGSVHGVEVGDCVINEEYNLVGFVSSVGSTWSVITTLIDTDMECGAIVFRPYIPAVAEGDFNLMQEGLLKLSYLPREAELMIGDTVVTSGTGGKFPPDIVIGEISEIYTESTGISDFAVIKPAADVTALRQVFIIKSFEISE